jgi:putative ABC transport system substrate-binding protein
VHVDRVIEGAKPADLAIEQPSKFHLVLNERTATSFGFAIPASLRNQASEVIR